MPSRLQLHQCLLMFKLVRILCMLGNCSCCAQLSVPHHSAARGCAASAVQRRHQSYGYSVPQRTHDWVGRRWCAIFVRLLVASCDVADCVQP
jgi:hypothetical protein